MKDIAETLMKNLREKGFFTLEAGEYMSGPIDIPSDSTLTLEKGAVLRFIPEFSLYKPVFSRWEGVKCYCMHPCVFINNAENVTIKGEGIIDGSGEGWWEYARAKKKATAPETDLEKSFAALNPGYESQPGGGGGRKSQFLRPSLLEIKDSKNVTVEGITLRNSPFWTVHPLFSDNLTFREVKVMNPASAPNTDGIDIDSSTNVRIIDSTVDVGDDGIAVKSGSGEDGIADGRPSEHILIKGCTVRSAHGGAVIGSETAAEISDVLVEDCFFDGTDRGIRIKTRRGRGGLMRNLTFRNIRMKDNLSPFVINTYYKCGAENQPELFSLDPMPITSVSPTIESVTIENCEGEGAKATAGMVVGLPELPIKNLVIRNCRFRVANEGLVNPDDTDMYIGLPSPASRGFRIRNAELTLDNVEIECEGEKILIEDGVVRR